MILDLKREFKTPMYQHASSSNYLDNFYKQEIEKLKEALLKSDAIIRNDKDQDVFINKFFKYLIDNIDNPNFFSNNFANKLKEIIADYPNKAKLLTSFEKIFLEMRIEISTYSLDVTHKFVEPNDYLKIVQNENSDDFDEAFKSRDLFENTVITELEQNLAGEQTATTKIKPLLKEAFAKYLEQYNLEANQLPKLSSFLNGSESIWNARYDSVEMGGLIFDLLKEEKSIYSPDAINHYLDASKSTINTEVLKLIQEEVLNAMLTTSFKWNEIFDKNSDPKNTIDINLLIPQLKDILKKYNLEDSKVEWSNFEIKNINYQQLQPTDIKALIYGDIKISSNNFNGTIRSFNDQEISINAPVLKRIFEYIQGQDYHAISRVFRPKEIMDILGIGSFDELLNLFNQGNTKTFANLNISKIKEIFGVDILTDQALKNLFRDVPVEERVSLSDLDLKVDVTLTKTSDEDPLRGILFSFSNVRVSLAADKDLTEKQEIKPIAKVSNTKSVQMIAPIEQIKNLIETWITPGKNFEYFAGRNGDKLTGNTPAEWLTNLFTNWKKDNVESKINQLLRDKEFFEANNGRFKFKLTQKYIFNQYTWTLWIEDTLLKHSYDVKTIARHVFDMKEEAETLTNWLKNTLKPIRTEVEKLNDQQKLTIEELVKIFERKDGLPISGEDFVLLLLNGESTPPKINIKNITFHIDNSGEKPKKTVSIEYEPYQEYDLSSQTEHQTTESFTIDLDVTTLPATQEDIDKATNDLNDQADQIFKDLKKQFPFNSDVSRDPYTKIINEFVNETTSLLEAGNLTQTVFNELKKKAEEKLSVKKAEDEAEFGLDNSYMLLLKEIFGGNVPKDILEWALKNGTIIKKMIDLNLSHETIRDILTNKWVRDQISSTGILDIKAVNKAIEALEKIKNNYNYAYFGTGIGLGLAGLASGAAAIASLKASKRTKKLKQTNTSIMSSKLIVATTSVISLLLLLGSSILMIWFFITQGGAF